MYSCNGCCFAEVKDGKQTDCLADKYKYLSKDKNFINDFFELDRLCLYKRDINWNKTKPVEKKLAETRSQLFPNIGICIDDTSEAPEDLDNLINQIINIFYPKNRIFVTIYSSFDKIAARIPKIISKLQSNNIRSYAVFKVENDIYENDTTIFKRMIDATFFVRINSDSKVDFQKSFNEINKKFNDELERILIFQDKDALFIDKTFVLRSYLDYRDYHKMMESLYNKTKDTEFFHVIE